MVPNLSLITVCFNPSLILVSFCVFCFFNDYDDEYDLYVTHLGWSGSIDLGPESVFFLEVSISILASANLDELI